MEVQDREVDEGRFLFIGGISLDARVLDIKKYLNGFGRVVKCEMPLHIDGTSKGYAYAILSSKEEVERVLSYGRHELLGKRVSFRRYMSSQEASEATKEMQERKLFVTGFHNRTVEEDVFRIFSYFGRVAKVLTPRDGICRRQFCYVIMEDSEAFNYLIALKRLEIEGQSLRLQQAVSINKLNKEATPSLSYTNHSTAPSSPKKSSPISRGKSPKKSTMHSSFGAALANTPGNAPAMIPGPSEAINHSEVLKQKRLATKKPNRQVKCGKISQFISNTPIESGLENHSLGNPMEESNYRFNISINQYAIPRNYISKNRSPQAGIQNTSSRKF